MDVATERRYFFQLFVSVLVSVGNGAIFCFGIFSPFMKAPAFSLSQTQVNIVSTCGVVLSYFSLPTGFLFDRYGPKTTLLVGAAMNFLGWLGMFLIFYDVEAPLLGTSTAVLSFFFGISQWSASFYETGSVLTNLEAMSEHKGRVIIIQKTFMGLGSSIITQFYIGFFQDRYAISTFFLFLMIFNTSLGILGALVIRMPTPSTRVVGLNAPCDGSDDVGAALNDPSYKSRFSNAFHYGTALLLLVVAYITGVTIMETYVTVTGLYRDAIGAVTLALLCLFAAMIPLVRKSSGQPKSDDCVETDPSSRKKQHRTYHAIAAVDASDGKEGLNAGSVAESEDRAAISLSVDSFRPDQKMPHSSEVPSSTSHALNEKPLLANLRTLDMQLMWIVSFAVWGCGTVVSTNSTQIYQALDFEGYNRNLDSVYVSIYGVASAVGRIVVGFGDEFLRTRGLHVVRLFPIAPIVNALGIPLFFVLPAKGLIVAFFFCGLATGLTWGSTVLIIKSLFSPNNCGKHYNVLYTAGMLTPILMNVALFGPLYDRKSEEQGLSASHTCKGEACVDVPLLTSLALNVIAIPCAFLLCRRVIRNKGIA